jgi:hypothetical protein
MADQPLWLNIVGIAAPIVLSPVVAWLLKRTGDAREESKREELKHRLEILDKLNTLKTANPNPELIALYETELRQVDALMRGSSRPAMASPTTGSPTMQGPPMTRPMTARPMVAPGAAPLPSPPPPAPLPTSWFGRFFLTSPAEAVTQRIFKGIFYAVFGFVCLGAVVFVVELMGLSEPDPEDGDSEPGYMFIGLIVWLAAALFFRHLARPKERPSMPPVI